MSRKCPRTVAPLPLSGGGWGFGAPSRGCQRSLPLGRTREDTVRQIVAGLTGDAEGSGDLANELSKADPVTLENGQESDDDISEPEDWVPDPVDADPGELRWCSEEV